MLFAAGIAFGYLVVLPGAVSFLQNFNASSFDALVRARSYYQFVLLTVLAIGAFFQIPVAVIGLNSAGIVSTRQLRQHRRQAIRRPRRDRAAPSRHRPVTTALELIPCSCSTNSASSPPACSSADAAAGPAPHHDR